ncbi:phosphoenolpyruvate carboxykinase (ATP), partial [candidate division WOR-3 bacterium]|nr:phosphoenolpyruvate carboxykinase (ATP) [candidate division WOR-3 bacterium]
MSEGSVLGTRMAELLCRHQDVQLNPERRRVIADVVARREAMVAACGCLATWTPPESTGRSPQDTVIVWRPESEKCIDWDGPNNLPLAPDTFDLVFADALAALAVKPRLYAVDRVLGADSSHALPVRVVSDRALSALFADNMFRPVPADIGKSCFASRPYTLVVLPYDKLDRAKYEGRLRKLPKTGKTSDMVIAMDMDRRIGVVYG